MSLLVVLMVTSSLAEKLGYCAGELIVKEAGGTVVDARGGSDSMENGQVLACSMKMLKPSYASSCSCLG